MDVISQLEEIFPTLGSYASRVRLDQFDNQTPCANFKVRDLFDHLIGGASQIGPQLRGEEPEAIPSGLTDEQRLRMVPVLLADVLEAAKTPGAFERTVQLPFGAVPGEVVVRFLTVDGTVHTSDLARAIGEDFEPDEVLTEEVLVSAQALIAPEMRDGDTFAAETPVPDGAPAITRLIAFTGRQI